MISGNKISSENNIILSAVPLKKQELSDIETIINQKLKRKINFKNLVDKSVIAGLYIRVGDQVFDRTIRRKIEKLKENLLP